MTTTTNTRGLPRTLTHSFPQVSPEILPGHELVVLRLQASGHDCIGHIAAYFRLDNYGQARRNVSLWIIADRYSPGLSGGRRSARTRRSRPIYPYLQIDGLARKEAFGVACANAVHGGRVNLTSHVLEDHPLSHQTGQQ